MKKFAEMGFVLLARVSQEFSRRNLSDFCEDFEFQILRVFEAGFLELSATFPLKKCGFFFEKKLRILEESSVESSQILLKFEDFFEVFESFAVSKIHEEYCYVSSQINHTRNAYSIRSFHLSQPSHCYLELSQLDKRYFRNSQAYEYSQMRLVLAKKADFFEELQENSKKSQNLQNSEKTQNLQNSQKNLSYIDGLCGRTRNSHLDLYLDSGLYYVIACMDYNTRLFESCLSFYGEEKVEFDREDYKENSGIFEEIMGEIAKKYGRKIEFSKDFYAKSYVSLKEKLLIEVFTNESQEVREIRRNYAVKGMKVIGQKGNEVTVRLEAGEERTVLGKLDEVAGLEEVLWQLNEEYLKDFKEL